MKIVFSRFLILLVVFFVSINAAFAFGDEDDEDEEFSKPKASVEGQVRYTTTNIWYQKPRKILILFHAGAMLPVGTKIILGDMNRKAVKFTDEHGTKFRIFTRKYYNLTGPAMAELLFSKKDPLAKGGKFHKFSKMEQKQIKRGQIKKGMSKQAVIMAYGPPPTHVNPSIEQNVWQLWKTRWNKLQVTFENGKVSRILD
jgi:uncharacterized membrane protein